MKREMDSLWFFLARTALLLYGDRRGRLYRLNIIDGSPLCHLERRDLA